MTKAISTEDTENITPSSLSTIDSEPHSISSTYGSTDAIINTQAVLSNIWTMLLD